MTFIRWITSLFSRHRREDATAPQLYLLLQRAHAHLQREEYDEARALLLQVTASRDSITDPNAIAYTLGAPSIQRGYLQNGTKTGSHSSRITSGVIPGSLRPIPGAQLPSGTVVGTGRLLATTLAPSS